MAVATVEEVKGGKEPDEKEVSRGAFVIEFGDNFGRYISVKCLGGDRFRGTWSQARMSVRKRGNGDDIGGRSMGEGMSRMPEIPGIRLKVEPKTRKVTIYDPLTTNPDLMETVNRRAKAAYIVQGEDEARPWKTVEQVMEDADLFKSLLIELAYMARDDVDMCRLKAGQLPTSEDLEKLPGEEMYDPCNTGQDHPKLLKDVKAWRDSINRLQV